MQRNQLTVSAQNGHNLDTGHEKCMEKRNVLLELPALLSAITIQYTAKLQLKVLDKCSTDSGLARTKYALFEEKNSTDTTLSPLVIYNQEVASFIHSNV